MALDGKEQSLKIERVAGAGCAVAMRIEQRVQRRQAARSYLRESRRAD